VIRVTGLSVYPVKSCGGIRVDAAAVTATGFRWDRRWMVVGEDGRFLSQREHPRLALVRVKTTDDRLVLSAPHLSDLHVPFERDEDSRVRVTVWRDECDAVNEGAAAAAWFSDHLGVGVRLVRLADDDARPLGSTAAQPGDRVSFADAYPFLLISEGSLQHLNKRLNLPVPMDRFRPNIVVDGCRPHAEDDWGTVRIGEVDFAVVKPCSRCVITTTNQQTGERGREPLHTLATYRLQDGQVLFGQNLVQRGSGVVRVGDRVVILDLHRHSTPFCDD
jgi:uncharacterized protein YcbX